MSETAHSSPKEMDPNFGIAPTTAAKLGRLFDATPGIEAVWIFGSRAKGVHRGTSDIDLALDAPDFSAKKLAALRARLEDLELLYDVDIIWLNDVADTRLGRAILGGRALFWRPSAVAS